MYLVNVKSTVKISSISEAFLENMNFKLRKPFTVFLNKRTGLVKEVKEGQLAKCERTEVVINST